MTDISATDSVRQSATRGGAFYRLVWKWHFLAALYVLPFLAMLSITGALYLYKPQIENWLYADRIYVEPGGAMVPLEMQIDQLDATVGIKRLRAVIPASTPDRATQIEFDTLDGTRSYAWINPFTTQIIAVQGRDDMIMRKIQKFHGELMLGSTGTKFVELAAHWAIIMLITGAILWWPRGQQTLKSQAALPKGTGRSFWKQTHLFSGMLAVVLITPILITGLPWTDVWGGAFERVQKATSQETRSLKFGGAAPKSTASSGETVSYATLEALAAAQGMVTPIEIRPPRDADGTFWIGTMSTHRYDQNELVVDRYSGALLTRIDFADNPVLAQATSLGISFHRGELYGWANIAQNTLAATLGVLLSVSGFLAWWMRRPKGTLGVPAAPEAQLSWPIAAVVVTLMVLLPLVGLSLILALALDWLVFRKLGWFRGASAPQPAE